MRTKEEVKEVVESLGYIYIDDYSNNKSQRKIIFQDNFGYKYDVYLSGLLSGRGIGFVEKRNPFTLSHNIPLWLKSNNSQFELLKDNEYKGAFSKLNLYCKKCKDYPKMTWSDIFKGIGCGICHGLQIGDYHNLAVQRPDIAKEWHPTLNRNLTPKDVTYASAKKVYWLCPKGHSYFSQISKRTSGGSCKICFDFQKESKTAIELKSYILSKYNSEEEYKTIRNPDTGKWLLYDIYIFGGKDLKINGIYIEVHGHQHFRFTPFWHKTRDKFEYSKKLDKLKKNFAKKNGIYIEVDLRKIKTTEQAIEYVESILEKNIR